jgi:predicted nucleotidyltransferase
MKPPRSTCPFPPTRHYSAPDIPMRVIQRYVHAIAEKFRPDRIILFGSFAYGTPHPDSDVDLLVVMPARSQASQAYKIRLALAAPFPMDLIVRTPETLKWRLEEGDSFLREIVSKGKVLYEKTDGRVGAQSRRGLPRGRPYASQRRSLP